MLHSWWMLFQIVLLPFISMMSLVVMFNLLMFDDLMSKWYIFDCYSNVFIWSMLWVGVSLFILPLSSEKVALLFSILFSFLFYSSSHLIWFFVWFEFSMIPMFFVILNTGSGAERMSASRFLFSYTLLGSVPLLVSSVSMFCYYVMTPYMWEIVMVMKFPYPFIYNLSWIAFLVKMPMFLVHNWLLKAHVEAPLHGSMFLAGVLLKFGAYGMIRYTMIIKQASLGLKSLLISISIWGSVLAGVWALMSFDTKQSVALASVSHMNLSISLYFTLTSLGMLGVIATMVAHSWSSVLLFFLATRAYEKVGSRSALLLKGSMSSSPMWGGLGIFGWSSNLSIPPFLGFIGEMLTFFLVSNYSPILGVILGLYFMASSSYSMIIYGSVYNTLPSFKKLTLPPEFESFLQELTCIVHLIILFWNISILW